MSEAEEKQVLRQTAKITRQSLDIETLGRQIREHILLWPLFQEAKTVLLYAALPGEVDLLPLAQQCSGKCFYLPRALPDLTLNFHAYCHGDALQPHAFGMPEPFSLCPPYLPEANAKTLVFIPALMLDRQGHRLGFGKGYYDRFLASEPLKSMTKVGVVPEQLLTNHLPSDPWDIPMDFAITENGIYHFK